LLSGRRHLRGSIWKEASGRHQGRHERIWEASGRHLGGIMEASGGIWEASGTHGRGIIWEASICKGSRKHLGGKGPQEVQRWTRGGPEMDLEGECAKTFMFYNKKARDLLFYLRFGRVTLTKPCKQRRKCVNADRQRPG